MHFQDYAFSPYALLQFLLYLRAVSRSGRRNAYAQICNHGARDYHFTLVFYSINGSFVDTDVTTYLFRNPQRRLFCLARSLSVGGSRRLPRDSNTPPFPSALNMFTHANESGNPHAGTSDVLVVSATTIAALEIRDRHCRNGVGQTGGAIRRS